MKTLSILLVFVALNAALAQNLGQKLDRFRSETNLTARAGMIGELAEIGGDQAFLEFKRCLFDTNLAGRQLRFREEVSMLGLVASMGYLAATSNLARDFLLNAIHPQFWKTNVLWRTELGDSEYSVLAARALGALGASGREEFERVTANVKQDIDSKPDGYLAGGLVDAHFQKYLVEKKGRNACLKIGADETMDEFQKWKDSPQGTNWYTWYLEKTR